MTHDEIQADLADYAARRLGAERSHAVAQHLTVCGECRDVVDDLAEIGFEVKRAGEALFEPHPGTAELREFALSGPATADSRIPAHLDLCRPCGLEVETWRRLGQAHAAPRERVRIRWGIAPWAGATAAGLLLGVLATMAFHRMASPGSSTTIDLGSPVLHILPDALRGGEPYTREWTLDRQSSYFSIAVPLAIPETTDDAQRYRIALRRVGGDVVWSTELTASRIREHMESADVVNIPAIPTGSVIPGRYEFSVLPDGAGEPAAVSRAVIVVSYRQSPAATNAPQ